MLSSNLTLDEEDAVQVELKELQAEAVRSYFILSQSVAEMHFELRLECQNPREKSISLLRRLPCPSSQVSNLILSNVKC